jgi:two-component system NtrC family sensor kinase
MSITYGIVKRLGGEIKVMSKLNEGTTMTIMLPKHSVEG